MPSASEEDRAWAREKFGTIDCGTIDHWLTKQGYTLSPQWLWTPPARTLLKEECRALDFLVEEWDYGGWAPNVDVTKLQFEE